MEPVPKNMSLRGAALKAATWDGRECLWCNLLLVLCEYFGGDCHRPRGFAMTVVFDSLLRETKTEGIVILLDDQWSPLRGKSP